MRKIFATIVLMLAVSMARASLNTFTVTVTNVPLPGSGTNLTVLGITRNWTNIASAFGIQTNSAGVNESATNLFRSWSSFPQLGVTVYMTGTNAVNFRGLDLTLSQGGTWASVVSNSVASSNLYGLMLPFANLPATVRTNQANEIANAIRNYSTNATFQVSTNFNLLDSATFVWGQSEVTNISGYPTNLTDSQISNVSAGKVTSGTLAMARGGTASSLSDPGADAFMFWDDALGSNRFSTLGTGLSYSSGVVNATGISATNITDAQIATNAAIERSKLAAGTANHVLINDGSGVASSEAQLALSRGGTGVTLSDPSTNAFLIWDDSANSNRFATIGSGLGYSGGVVSAGNFPASAVTSGTLALAVGGTASSLSDPGAHAFLIWDDSVNSNRFATLGTALSYSTGVINAWSGPIGNSVFVSKSGNDATGARGSLSTPFLTVGAAKDGANSGDTIFVFPGTYEPPLKLLKNGVNWHFFSGASVVYTGAGSTFAIFDDDDYPSGATSVITGDGEFDNEGSTGGHIGVVNIQHASTFVMHAKSITSDSSNPVGVCCGAATVKIIDAEITGQAAAAVAISDSPPAVTLERCRLISQATGNNGAALFISTLGGILPANTKTILKDCTLIADSGASTPLSISSDTNGSQIRIYGMLTANYTNNSTNITFTVGASRFEVDTDVE